MSTLQVANLHVESTGNNRIQYVDSKLAVVAGGSNVIVGNSTITEIYGGLTPFIESNSSVAIFKSGSSNVIVSNSTSTSIKSNNDDAIVSNSTVLVVKSGSSNVIVANSTVTSIKANNTDRLVANSTGLLANNVIFDLPREKINVAAVAANGTINFDVLSQGILYYTTNAASDWILNVRGDGSNQLNSIMSDGESLTVNFLVTQGATAYYANAFQIDGSARTPKWFGAAPTAGNANSVDAYTYTVVKTAANTYTIFASQSAYV